MIQKVKKAINKLFKDIWGENPLTFYFSFDGRFIIHEYLQQNGTDPELLKAMEGYMEQYCVL